MDPLTALPLPAGHSPRIARLWAFRDRLREFASGYPDAAPHEHEMT